MAWWVRRAKWIAVCLACWASVAWAQPEAGPSLKTVLDALNLSSMPPSAQAEFSALLADEFDYCGRPLTLLASLRKGDACAHTKRLSVWAARQLEGGALASEVTVALAKYNAAFSVARSSLQVPDAQCLGNKDAPVTLVEFSDFECPYCGVARPVLEAFAKSRSDVRFCSALFPLAGHLHSGSAAVAALVARDAGKFWKVHDALFERQAALSDAVMADILKKEGLSPQEWSKALDNGKYLSELEVSKKMAKDAGVLATPALFVNGRKFHLPIEAEALRLAVDDELEWQNGKQSWLKTAAAGAR